MRGIIYPRCPFLTTPQIEMIGMDRWARFKLCAFLGVHALADIAARYWVNDGTKFVIITLFLLANAALFLERFFYYWKGGGKAVRRSLSSHVPSTFSLGLYRAFTDSRARSLKSLDMALHLRAAPLPHSSSTAPC